MLRTSIGGTQFVGRLAGDFSGVALASAGDANGDGFLDLLIGAPLSDRLNDAGAPVADDSGAASLVYGTGATLPAVVDLSDLAGPNGILFREIGDERAEFGTSVGALGDFNGDGFDDIVVGAPFRARIEDQDTGEGAAYIRFGAPASVIGTISTPSISGGSGVKIIGSAGDSFLGLSVAGAGDFNGDGLADALIGMPGLGNAAGVGTGGAVLVFGSAASIPNFPETTDALNGTNGLRLVGEAVGDFAGVSVASAGDFNGDGRDDLLIGATGASGGAGAAYVVFGRANGGSTINLASLNGATGFRLTGVEPGDRTGIFVAPLGDVNGDGRDDLIVGADEAGGSGRAYVVFGSAAAQPASRALGSLNGANGFRIDGISLGDSVGTAVAGAGDVNGDGIGDILVAGLSANPFGEASAGETYLIFGRATGFNPTFSPESLNGTNGYVLAGEFSQDVSGAAVAAAGDMNGDGFGDFLIGAPGADIADDANAGVSYLIYGGAQRLRAQDALDGTVDGLIDLRGLGDAITFFDGATVEGTDASETLRGGAGADGLFGRDGQDRLVGNGGADFFDGGGGDDRVIGQAANDSVVGGAGTDVIYTYAGNDRVEGGDGGDNIRSGVGNDRVDGNAGDDIVKADEGDDLVRGGVGADTISGWRGADSIEGGDGDDVIRGEFDRDRIEGGAGSDRLLGGSDIDVFVFRAGFGEDRVLDFNPFVETLDFSGHSGVDGFGDLSISALGGLVLVEDGSGGRLILSGVALANIGAADFVF